MIHNEGGGQKSPKTVLVVYGWPHRSVVPKIQVILVTMFRYLIQKLNYLPNSLLQYFFEKFDKGTFF